MILKNLYDQHCNFRNFSLNFRKITSATDNFIITATGREMKMRISQEIASAGHICGQGREQDHFNSRSNLIAEACLHLHLSGYCILLVYLCPLCKFIVNFHGFLIRYF